MRKPARGLAPGAAPEPASARLAARSLSAAHHAVKEVARLDRAAIGPLEVVIQPLAIWSKDGGQQRGARQFPTSTAALNGFNCVRRGYSESKSIGY